MAAGWAGRKDQVKARNERLAEERANGQGDTWHLVCLPLFGCHGLTIFLTSLGLGTLDRVIVSERASCLPSSNLGWLSVLVGVVEGLGSRANARNKAWADTRCISKRRPRLWAMLINQQYLTFG